jgi:hypothetical protein
MTRSIRLSSSARLLFALLLAMFFSASQAASLGRINVQSALGEAFRAEVELSNVGSDELNNLVIRTASPDTFRRNGVDFNPAVLSIKAALIIDGVRPFIALRSSDGIQEPLLEILLEISSDKGNFVKKFTVLLDPPLSKQSASEAASAQALLNAGQSYNHSTLSLKPSFNLNQQSAANASARTSTKAASNKKMSKREWRAFKKAQRKEARLAAKNKIPQDKLSVVAPNPSNSIGQETPQSLARRLVKAGIKDPAQIEALINALNAAKDSTAKPQQPSVTPPSPSLPPVVSVIDLPPFAAVPTPLPSVLVVTPVADAPPLPAAPMVKRAADIWSKYFDSLWMLATLLGALLLGVLAWFIYSKRAAAQEQEDYDDYQDMEHTVIAAQKPSPNPTPAAKVLYEGGHTSHTQAFESQFLTEIKIDESLVQAVSIEPIEHAKNMINQGNADNATTFLKDLLHDKPDDQSVRLMLITVLIDKKNDEALNEQMEVLGNLSHSKGEHWLEAKKLFLAYKAQQQTALEIKQFEATKSNASNDTATIDFPSLSLDLSHPTIFAPPNHEILQTLKPLEFTLSDLHSDKPQTPTKTNSLFTLVSPPTSKPKTQPAMSAELLKKLSQLEEHIKNNDIASAQSLMQAIAESSEKTN